MTLIEARNLLLSFKGSVVTKEVMMAVDVVFNSLNTSLLICPKCGGIREILAKFDIDTYEPHKMVWCSACDNNVPPDDIDFSDP